MAWSHITSLGFQLDNVLSGQRRDVVAALVATNFSEARLANQFCTICRKSFSSSCCTDHMGCHHPGIEDENNEHVIGIERHPCEWTLDLEGRLLIAIHRYNHGIIQGTMCPCSRIIALGFLYCSLECKVCMINFFLFKGHEQNESQISLLCFQGNHFWN
uniref:Uncharacterized protein n=1 Tax=Oryza barthii TaxID=65489 RepID=A0A0D3HBR3_9ORYZ